MEWIISDTHFGHKNIITYCSRPYQSVRQQDDDLERRWTNRVKPDDIIYHLGDVGYIKGYQTDNIITDDSVAARIRRLPGRKILILGNHDKSPGVMRSVGFDVVCQSMVVKVPNMNSCYVLLNHRPLQSTPLLPDPVAVPNGISYVLHGHIHNSTEETRREHINKGELVHIPSHNINCSVEVINYEPVGLEWMVKNHIKNLKLKGKY